MPPSLKKVAKELDIDGDRRTIRFFFGTQHRPAVINGKPVGTGSGKEGQVFSILNVVLASCIKIEEAGPDPPPSVPQQPLMSQMEHETGAK